VIALLFVHVLIDIVRSCINVSLIILGPREWRQRSGFMSIPLDLRDPHGLAVLSAIINSTPGTVWAEISEDRLLLMIHVLDLHDEQWWTNTIKTRYETPLRAIFE
jgi:multicomponent K+:H+ antiporter subunit E